MTKKVLINASNLHTGGAIQVAASFLAELAHTGIPLNRCELTIYVSSAVHNNLRATQKDSLIGVNYHVLDVHGLEALKPSFSRMFRGFDLVFTIFGPLYLPFQIPRHLVGFAQPWIIFPDNELGRRFGIFKRLQTKLKYYIQSLFFRTASRLIVELDHVKQELLNTGHFRNDRIDVVRNCVSAIFFDPSCWIPLAPALRPDAEVIRIGFVTRDYPHKNLDFLPQLAEVLHRVSKLRYQFCVTLNNDEWQRRSDHFRSSVANVGALSIAQCPFFYEAVDAVIFPSLLECFSATPLEAMVMRKPLFASDRTFVRDCCEGHALYFDPLDAGRTAAVIKMWFEETDRTMQKQHIEAAYSFVCSQPNSKDRADSYLSIIRKELQSECATGN